ncbi:MAG: hypothetical protein KGH49_00710 [Candidatus Micrarchaeota archaeon]|nr:hypothetical protein [Candidatus Micrarchaeota archaeon]
MNVQKEITSLKNSGKMQIIEANILSARYEAAQKALGEVAKRKDDIKYGFTHRYLGKDIKEVLKDLAKTAQEAEQTLEEIAKIVKNAKRADQIPA